MENYKARMGSLALKHDEDDDDENNQDSKK